jgi:hypothetical protein
VDSNHLPPRCRGVNDVAANRDSERRDAALSAVTMFQTAWRYPRRRDTRSDGESHVSIDE